MNQMISTVSGSPVKAARRSFGLALSKRFTIESGPAVGLPVRHTHTATAASFAALMTMPVSLERPG